ncbi:uncharacterized protein CTRU02_215691 [Colletotrichum truncatum]|uniref:Uncharacterized protein n=1 Tax=Colletotrichum truncatum TaxID=5467 RepID=A0ACC3YBZ7_COLTU|nr:uncharacterized protein CTRU02_15125 [Colletotrichum truncatum]KAF6781418.1 hypothetical protein CTRU02_15125 [Colletotrichum truncatum]
MDPTTTDHHSSPPIHISLELNDHDDEILPPIPDLFSESQQTPPEHESSTDEHSLENPIPASQLADLSPPGEATCSTAGHRSYVEPESDRESPFSTPAPEQMPLWTELETGMLIRFLHTACSPLSVGEISEYMARSLTDTAAMVVCLWLSAVRVSEARGTRLSWWIGRPVFNSIGSGRVSVFLREGNQIMLRFYDVEGDLEAEAPIHDPSQMYDEGSF